MQQDDTSSTAGRAVLAGLAGTAVLTAFRKIVEMPITRRETSCAPAESAERVLSVRPTTRQGRRRLNDATHFALGGMWGAAYGVAAARGPRRQRAVSAVFAVVYNGDVLLNIALGLSQRAGGPPRTGRSTSSTRTCRRRPPAPSSTASWIRLVPDRSPVAGPLSSHCVHVE